MSYLVLQGDAEHLPFDDQSIDFVFGSPPYVDARLYLEGGRNLGIARKCQAWVDWMLRVTLEAQRVCSGPVLWVAAGKTKDRNYWPACEGLMWEWWKLGGNCQLYRPCYWHRVGIPGSGGDQWFRSDIEHVMCFKRKGKLPWSDNTAMGSPPKYKNIGGKLSHRCHDGSRVSHEGRSGDRVSEGNIRQDGTFYKLEIANPGNLVHYKVGGGHLGSKHAHENEAPFPEKLAEHFIRSLCPVGGSVLDPFGGSGTTAKVAALLGRFGISMDLRESQCELTSRRLREEVDEAMPLFRGTAA